MSPAQVTALGELLDSENIDAAELLAKANGFILVREGNPTNAWWVVVNVDHSSCCRKDALRSLYNELSKNPLGEVCGLLPLG